jgi:hypothetical protein
MNQDQKDDEINDDHFYFNDVITIIKNLLNNNVIYDFDCN